jgi:hypothetical protein
MAVNRYLFFINRFAQVFVFAAGLAGAVEKHITDFAKLPGFHGPHYSIISTPVAKCAFFKDILTPVVIFVKEAEKNAAVRVKVVGAHILAGSYIYQQVRPFVAFTFFW